MCGLCVLFKFFILFNFFSSYFSFEVFLLPTLVNGGSWVFESHIVWLSRICVSFSFSIKLPTLACLLCWYCHCRVSLFTNVPFVEYFFRDRCQNEAYGWFVGFLFGCLYIVFLILSSGLFTFFFVSFENISLYQKEIFSRHRKHFQLIQFCDC